MGMLRFRVGRHSRIEFPYKVYTPDDMPARLRFANLTSCIRSRPFPLPHSHPTSHLFPCTSAPEVSGREFPDEVDTPDDIPARQRFAKYRGLKSFRSSPWDPKESLPPEYARIFSFDNWKRTQKAAEERAAAVDRGEVPGSVGAGTFVRLHIMNVPCFEAERLQHEVTKRGLPLVVTGLLQHETRMTVLHFSVKKSDSFAPAIKSKQRLLFHCGFRRFYSRPTFSTDDINLDKHKFERFLHPGRFAVASIFAPTLFPPLPLLVFADPSAANQHTGEGVGGGSVGGSVVGGSVVGEGEELQLAATGALRGPDPDRIILKKIVLSGDEEQGSGAIHVPPATRKYSHIDVHSSFPSRPPPRPPLPSSYPVSVMKRKAVVRYMFHQPEDGRWFQQTFYHPLASLPNLTLSSAESFHQPVELFTKYGWAGRIHSESGGPRYQYDWTAAFTLNALGGLHQKFHIVSVCGGGHGPWCVWWWAWTMVCVVVGMDHGVCGGGHGPWCVWWWAWTMVCVVVGMDHGVCGGGHGPWCVWWWAWTMVCVVVGMDHGVCGGGHGPWCVVVGMDHGDF
ncbi:unnamed protein product [Closterium sp. NIES-64]|nr:unnamed protein product [Closterium sp. NIES-64]